jgi:hypothetical protein
MICPQCGGKMSVISFLTDFSVVDRIIDHLKLTFAAVRPPPYIAYQGLLATTEASGEYSSEQHFPRRGGVCWVSSVFGVVRDWPTPWTAFQFYLTRSNSSPDHG